MSVTIQQQINAVRADLGDPNGVNPLWDSTSLLYWVVFANRQFSAIANCLWTEMDVTTGAGTNAYLLGGEVILQVVESAYNSWSTTYHEPLKHELPYSWMGWGRQDLPHFWGVYTLLGYRYLFLMPAPNAVYTIHLTGTRISADQPDATHNTDLPSGLEYAPRFHAMMRAYQASGDVRRSAYCRQKFMEIAFQTRKAYSRPSRASGAIRV